MLLRDTNQYHQPQQSREINSTYLELLHKGPVDLAVHRSQNTLLGESSVQDLLDGDGAGDTDQLGHGGVSVGVGAAVLDESGQAGLLGAVLQLDFELVLKAKLC